MNDRPVLETADGAILDANPKACRVLRRGREVVVAGGFAAVFDPSDPRLENLRGVVTFRPGEQIKHLGTWPEWDLGPRADPMDVRNYWQRAWVDETDWHYMVTLGVEILYPYDTQLAHDEALAQARDIPSGSLRAQVVNRTRRGFYIRLEEPATKMIAVHWHVMR